MATQDPTQGSPLWYEPEQENVRLLELPQQLVDLIESSNDPSVFIKSASDGPDNHIVLCTRTQTYTLRQVQTSNSVFVVRPTTRPVSEDSPVPTDGLSLFITCSSSLEITLLDQEDASNVPSPAQWLRDLAPAYFGPDGVASTMTKEQVFTGVPYSDRECQEAWEEVCGFECEAMAYVPTGSAIVVAWQNLQLQLGALARAIAEPIILDEDLTELLDATELPRELYMAMLQKASNIKSADDIQQYILEKETTMALTGKALHDSKEFEGRMWQFVEAWKAMLPQAWQGEITTKTYMTLRNSVNETDLELQDWVDRISGRTATSTEPLMDKRPGGLTRDWHARFKRNRK